VLKMVSALSLLWTCVGLVADDKNKEQPPPLKITEEDRKCPKCKGTGELGRYKYCPDCKATGFIPGDPSCKLCGGRGSYVVETALLCCDCLPWPLPDKFLPKSPDDKPKPSAKAAWAWTTSQRYQKDACKECKGNCSCSPCTCASAKKAEPGKLAPATLVIELPTTAQLYVQGVQQYGTGEQVRTFQSPPLEPGKTYSYTIRVKDIFGKEETATVEVFAGKTSRVSFIRLPAQLFQNFYTGPRSGGTNC
jgi:uncharacterized protein (TIGR03000 family)